MEKKLSDLYIEDTTQTKRMKELALNFAYSNNGEMFRLLSMKVGHNLVKKIKKGIVKLPSIIKYGRNEITNEEKFLENLDNYITYVKNHYYINNVEQLMIIELSLENKYSSILYSDIDFYNGANYEEYHDAYRKMFFYNFYKNILFYSNSEDNRYCFKVKQELNNLNYDNSKDILKIEELFERIIINRKNNLFNGFVDYKKINKKQYSFYSLQLEWIIEDYYKKNTLCTFEIREDDNYIKVANDSIILLNISNVPDNNRFYYFEFGIKNNNFNAKSKFVFEKNDLNKLIKRLSIIKDNHHYDEKFDFISSELKASFWSDRGIEQFLNIEYEYGRDIDHYFISLGQEDINKFSDLIRKQLD